MSDTATIPFQTSNGLEAPAQGPDDTPGSNRRNVYLLGAAGAGLLLLVGGYFLFFAGGDAPAPAAPAPQPSAAPVQPAAPAAEPAAPATARKINARTFGTDPFTPLVQEVAAGTGDTTTTGGTTTGGTTTGGSTATGATTGSTDTSTSGSTVTAPAATARHSFRVVSVAPDNSSVTVKVDGTTYTNVRAGEVFATYFKVVLIGGTTNAFQYGEEKFNVLGTKRLTIA